VIEQNDTGAAGNRGAGNHDPGHLIMAAVAVAYAGLLYWLRATNQTPDGLSYALAVRSGLEMFHPHHMIYVPVARWIHLVTGIDPITATLWQNLFWIVVLGLAAWRLAGLVFPGRWARILAVGSLLAARGVMIYSVRVETYLPALACLVLATSLAVERPVRSWLLAPSVALAILYHQTNVLFVLPLLVLLCPMGETTRWLRDWRRATINLIVAAALVIGFYVVGFKYESVPGGFWNFVLSYARAPIEAWGNWDYYSPTGILTLAGSQANTVVPIPAGASLVGGLVMLGGLVFLVTWHIVRVRQKAPHGAIAPFRSGFPGRLPALFSVVDARRHGFFPRHLASALAAGPDSDRGPAGIGPPAPAGRGHGAAPGGGKSGFHYLAHAPGSGPWPFPGPGP